MAAHLGGAAPAHVGIDNSFMESCFGTIKTELEMEVYASVRVA